MTAGPGGRHDVERDIPEILQEVRVAQTGGQLFFAFLFSVAFAPGFDDLDGQQRLLYACDLFVVATASTLLVAPVAIHRWNFGRVCGPSSWWRLTGSRVPGWCSSRSASFSASG